MDPITALAVLGGGGFLVVKAVGDADPTPVAKGSSVKSQITSKADSVRAKLSSIKLSTPMVPLSKAQQLKTNPMFQKMTGTFKDSKKSNGQTAGIEKMVAAKAKDEFNKLTLELKKKACQKLKDAYPNEPSIRAIDCNNPNFDNIMKGCAAAIGAGVCTAYGGAAVATTCGAVAGWVESWAGPEIREWHKDALRAVGLDDVADGLTWTENGIANGFDEINPF